MEFKKAVRENVGLLIALAGASGSGKTYSAMRLASGIVGKGNRFAVIDTEARRALHYADDFDFDHLHLEPPFTPDRIIQAIKAADKAGYKAIVVDSMSHEYAGEGGILDWQEKELDRMAGQDYKKRENCKMSSWIAPKMAHKKMMQSLLQVQTPMIFCLRAEEKTIIVKNDNGKNVPVNAGFQPICEKNFMYEMTASFLLYPEKSGIPEIIKCERQHKAHFTAGKHIDEKAGQSLAEWAKGGVKTKEKEPAPVEEEAQEKHSQTFTLYLLAGDDKFDECECETHDEWLEKFELSLKHLQGTDRGATTDKNRAVACVVYKLLDETKKARLERVMKAGIV